MWFRGVVIQQGINTCGQLWPASADTNSAALWLGDLELMLTWKSCGSAPGKLATVLCHPALAGWL